MKKNVTINGINYRLTGHIYVPTDPVEPELNGISEHGTMHYYYLRMAHPNQLKGLEKSGLLMDYLKAFDRKAKRYLRSRHARIAMPSLDDPDFEREYRSYILVNRNTESNLISKFILQGVHQDILQRLFEKIGTPSARKETKKV